jgi:Retrotransposon gag protein
MYAQQRMIAHINERLAAMKDAGKIGDEKMQLLTNQLHSAASVLADVTGIAEDEKTCSNPPGIRQPTPLPSQAFQTLYYPGSTT